MHGATGEGELETSFDIALWPWLLYPLSHGRQTCAGKAHVGTGGREEGESEKRKQSTKKEGYDSRRSPTTVRESSIITQLQHKP